MKVIWKILPGFLLGQWAAMMAYFLLAYLTGRPRSERYSYPSSASAGPGDWAAYQA